MLVLTRLVLNPQSALVMRELNNPYDLHRTVLSGFPQLNPEEERILFRLEIQRKNPVLSMIVQSSQKPDYSKAVDRGMLISPPQSKTIELHPQAADRFRFRLMANPTRRLRKQGGATGEKNPRVGLLREEEQLAWLIRKASQHGFEVLGVQTAKINQPVGYKPLDGRNLRISHQAVRFDGYLQVQDPEKFMQALIGGIGSGKAFGFGLLSLARAI